MELSFGLGASIIVADLLFTLGVLLLVYFCSKKQQALFRAGAPRRLQGKCLCLFSPPLPSAGQILSIVLCSLEEPEGGEGWAALS